MRKLIPHIILFLALPLQAATYYVDDTNGLDSNDGSSWEESWKTLARAYDSNALDPNVAEGDTVIFKDGNYGTFTETSAAGPDYLFYRTDWIIYEAATGHSPVIDSIVVKNLDYWGGDGDGNSYLAFDGFDIPNGVSVQYTSYVKVLDCNIRTIDSYSSQSGPYAPYIYYSVGVFIRDNHHITIEGNEISYSNNGIGFGGTGTDMDNITIKNNWIHRLAEDGIQVSCNQLLIEGNTIQDITNQRTTVWIRGDVTGAFDEGEIAIQPGSGEEGVVDTPPGGLATFNLAVMQTTANRFTEGGGTITGQDSGATITNITKVDGAHSDATEIQDAGITGVTFRDNIIIREGTGGSQALKFHLFGIYDITIENNVIWAPKPIMGGGEGETQSNILNFNNNTICGIGSYGLLEGITEDFNTTNMYNNIFACDQVITTVANHGNNIFMNDPGGFAEDGSSIIYSVGDPCSILDMFVNATAGDFTLAADANAIDFGNATYAPATDLLGITRPQGDADDAGAYEYVTGVIYYFLGSSGP